MQIKEKGETTRVHWKDIREKKRIRTGERTDRDQDREKERKGGKE